MGKKANGVVSTELSRRDFLKVAGAGAAALTATDFAARPARAEAVDATAWYHTTCPYCSASCGQIVAVDASGNVLDIYGDKRSPFNSGGLCAKGAGALQLVNNPRRLGAWAGAHPVDPAFEYDATYGANGIAYKRIGDGAWTKMALDTAFHEIVSGDGSGFNNGVVSYRGTVNPADVNTMCSKGVAFFGSSHMNIDQNYIYKKLICNFGTNNVEHQARI
jgi:anaerobic selenocysteine-containing dehydrogenase